jgi:hypothetical protein
MPKLPPTTCVTAALAKITSDNVLAKGEKGDVIEYSTITAEYPGFKPRVTHFRVLALRQSVISLTPQLLPQIPWLIISSPHGYNYDTIVALIYPSKVCRLIHQQAGCA